MTDEFVTEFTHNGKSGEFRFTFGKSLKDCLWYLRVGDEDVLLHVGSSKEDRIKYEQLYQASGMYVRAKDALISGENIRQSVLDVVEAANKILK